MSDHRRENYQEKSQGYGGGGEAEGSLKWAKFATNRIELGTSRRPNKGGRDYYKAIFPKDICQGAILRPSYQAFQKLLTLNLKNYQALFPLNFQRICIIFV